MALSFFRNKKSYVPHHNYTFWPWELINVLIPIMGILFFNWHIMQVVWLFWFEVFLWVVVGLLKILSANGSTTLMEKISSRLFALTTFGITYFALFILLFSFSFIEISTETLVEGTGKNFSLAFVLITFNYIIEYIRNELMTGHWKTTLPMEVVFERFIYAMPLVCLVLFAVLPLAKKLTGANTEKVIAIGMILAKLLMNITIRQLPSLLQSTNEAFNGEE